MHNHRKLLPWIMVIVIVRQGYPEKTVGVGPVRNGRPAPQEPGPDRLSTRSLDRGRVQRRTAHASLHARTLRHSLSPGEVTEQELRTPHGVVTELSLGRRQRGHDEG